MRKDPTRTIENYRVASGPMGSQRKKDGPNGLFNLPLTSGAVVQVIASDGRYWDKEQQGDQVWEHVSVSLTSRCPAWEEMREVKEIFWRDGEQVMQFHFRPGAEASPFCLHMWMPVGVDVLAPTSDRF